MKILLKTLQHISSRLQVAHSVIICRRNISSSGSWTLHALKSRGLIQLSGTDVNPFLQGLVTNDVTVLGPECTSLHAMLLNVQGRVMYDLLLYHKVLEDNLSVIVEHDRRITTDLIKTLKRYRIRKKVNILDISDDLQVFAALPPGDESCESDLSLEHKSLYLSSEDPRINTFGRRIVAPSEDNVMKCVHQGSELIPSTEDEYHERRYMLGLSEGIIDLPPGNCFPLESNLVYLNGVCFHKGCYIGQELTARTFHTGVTRKRLMPLKFESVPTGLSAGDNIVNEKGKSIGKFRNCAVKHGLGLLRVAEIKGTISVTNKDGQIYNVQAMPPEWWPKDEDKGYL